jgi:hypothetical protein
MDELDTTIRAGMPRAIETKEVIRAPPSLPSPLAQSGDTSMHPGGTDGGRPVRA